MKYVNKNFDFLVKNKYIFSLFQEYFSSLRSNRNEVGKKNYARQKPDLGLENYLS